MNFQMFGERRSGAREPLLKQERVLVDEAEGTNSVKPPVSD